MVGKHPEDILALELWDVILKHVVADHRLLHVARVCRVFNELAVSLYLRRNKLCDLSGAQASGAIIRPHIITALYLACIRRDRELHIRTLSCLFLISGLVRSIRSLGAVVDRCPDLTHLHLQLSTSLPHNARDLIAALCDVFSAMSKKVPGPVFLAGNSTIHKFEQEEIALSRAHNPHSFIAVLEAQRKSHMDLHVRSISSDSRNCFTLIIFDWNTLSLTLSPSNTLSAADSSTVLPHLRFSYVRSLNIQQADDRDLVLSTALVVEFITQHPTLKAVHYNYSDRPAEDGDRDPSLFARITGCYLLTRWRTSAAPSSAGIFNVRREPPILGELSRLPHKSSSRAAQQARARIHTHIPPGFQHSSLSVGTAAALPSTQERAALQNMHSLVGIRLFTTSVADARALLPWLKVLPALRQLEISNSDTQTSSHNDPAIYVDAVAFIGEVHAALPLVTDL